MIRVATSQKKDDWMSKITSDEKASATKIVSILQKNHPIQFQQAHAETYILDPDEKSPGTFYELSVSNDTSSKTEIHTDGFKNPGRIYSLANGSMQSFTIENFTYIVVKNHLPNPNGKNSADSYYQSVVCKTWGLKLYTQSLLGLPMG